MLFRIAPPALQRRLESVRRIHEPHERNAKLLEALNACEPQFRGLLSARELMNQEYEGWEPSILISFLARLMCAFPGIPRSGKPDALVPEIDDALVDLDAVREFLRRSQRQSKFYRDEELARKARKTSDTPTTSGTVVACDDEKDGAAPGPPNEGDNQWWRGECQGVGCLGCARRTLTGGGSSSTRRNEAGPARRSIRGSCL